MSADKQRALVLGLGASGEAAARLLVSQGYAVTVADAADAETCAVRAEALQELRVRVLVDVTMLPDTEFDLCVVSPGIAESSAWVRELDDRGVEVISELELGFRYCQCPIVAVTGTNGKSTLVKLINEILESAGLRSMVAGNYGIPLCDRVEASKLLDWLVVEVSSFQLERVSTFRPRVGILLNLQPDHLNRHGDMATYRGLKARLFRHMDPDDAAIVQEDELAPIRSLVSDRAQWITFGTSSSVDLRYDASGYVMGGNDTDRGKVLDVRGTRFDNPILGQATAAAVAAAEACGVSPEAVARALRAFVPLPHRMEPVTEVNGITFINDSKATNLASLVAGVQMVSEPTRLIAGGQLKEKDLEFAKEVLATHVASVYLIGDAADAMQMAWHETVPCVCCETLERATSRAYEDAQVGDTVLLSPGCASFDQFTSYRDRGEAFGRIVEDINEERADEDVTSN